ncbi:MAG: redoxin domain-containing protein [Gemmataceae bacterium]|nr:redoxin domain-containing protein [Gemmataceae bacterium]
MTAARCTPVVLAGLVVALIGVGGTAAPPEPKAAGDITLTDAAGKPSALADVDAKAVVVAFLATDCPMSNGYLPALNDVAAKYADRGVRVVGVVPDPDTTAGQLAAHAKEYKLAFPVLRDPKGAAVAALGPKVTPEVVVLDGKRVVRYRGRIDDGYVGRLKPKAVVTRHDLVAALDEVLAGKPVTVGETKAFGCPVPAPEKAEAAAAPVTFYKDVLPVFQAHCQSCHRPGQVGPFALTTYKQAARWADTSLAEVHAGRMPPWKPAPNPLLAGGRALPAAARETLERWVAQGMPEGDPKDAPPAPAWPDGWTLGEPDLILESPADTVVAASGKDLFRVQVFPTNLPEDKDITAIEVRPGNPRVVHHTLQIVDTTGTARKFLENYAETDPKAPDRGPGYPVAMGWGFMPNPNHLLGGWAPGMLPKHLPDGVAQKLPKGGDVCVQFHYHRTGKEERDRTKIGLYFAKKPAALTYRSIPVSGLIPKRLSDRILQKEQVIPAGEKAYTAEKQWELVADVTAYRVVPHMHLLGKSVELTATPPGGKSITLISIPAWDYNWQEQYELKEPVKLPKDTVLTVRATFDNSADNPLNPSVPPAPVRYGEQTTDEMAFVFLGVTSASDERSLIWPKGLPRIGLPAKK